MSHPYRPLFVVDSAERTATPDRLRAARYAEYLALGEWRHVWDSPVSSTDPVFLLARERAQEAVAARKMLEVRRDYPRLSDAAVEEYGRRSAAYIDVNYGVRDR